MIRLTVLAAGLLAALVPGLARSQGAPVPSSGDAAHGHALFMADGCYECHGTVGQGGPGVRLAPKPLPAEAIAMYIRNPTGEMPPFTSKVVSDADIRDIEAYLATIPDPPAVTSIPELK
jgi:ubiquinol-cytochrome c reductase cytochrome c subunit